MSVLTEQVRKAKQRLDFRPDLLRDSLRDKVPKDLSNASELETRREFLRESLPDGWTAEQAFERVISGNELVSINYLERGVRAARAVARIHLKSDAGNTEGFGTGFLIAPTVLITNNHVLPSARSAQNAEAHFEYERDIEGKDEGPVVFGLDPSKLFFTSQELDFTVVSVTPSSTSRPLSDFGVLPFLGNVGVGKVLEGEWLTIIQHPNGERKQVCVRDNRLLRRSQDVLWYSTDTLGGSSGSPVFNNDWYVVALHHSGVPEERNGRIQTRDGQDYNEQTMDETRINWIANEGIRTSRIVETLESALPGHPLLAEVYSATPTNRHPLEQPPSHTSIVTKMNTPITIPIHLNLRISPDGSAVVTSGSESIAAENAQVARLLETRTSSRRRPAVRTSHSKSAGKGFDENFLGEDHRVHLPKLSPSIAEDAVHLLNPQGKETKDTELKYTHFSVTMSKSRRFALFSAANVNFGQRWELGSREDKWIWDDRIPRKYQIDNWLYASNQFDRGHLTRHNDVKWGVKAEDAIKATEDSCSWTNCVPMHSQFNQKGDETPLWFELEQYILEDSIEESGFRAQVITGPVLQSDDPEYKGVQYPVSFWKVVAAINSKRELFATAYLLSQADTIDQYGIEAAREIPFGAFETYQTSISEIEALTGLEFKHGAGADPLSKVDPLAKRRIRSERRRVSHPEALIL